MTEFEDWARSLPKWSDRLIELGASWDSFRREPDEVIKDLQKGGIPLLAARDIIDKAREALRRKGAPMAVFWDLGTVTLPISTAGLNVTTKLKSVLSCYGALILMKAYLSGNMAPLSDGHRSDMIKSGFVLIDSPLGGKEVATKRIIIDAMKFASDHPDTASICLITGDPDVSYLLSALKRPSLTTMLVSDDDALKRMMDSTPGSSAIVELSKMPKTLYDLWFEYIHGIGGRKAAKDFTLQERGKYKCNYSKRKTFWDVIARHVNAGYTSAEAIDKVYQCYGRKLPVTSILKLMIIDKKRKGHPNLRV